MAVLDVDECWLSLAQAEVGRIAVAVQNRPEIFPVNFVIDGILVLPT